MNARGPGRRVRCEPLGTGTYYIGVEVGAGTRRVWPGGRAHGAAKGTCANAALGGQLEALKWLRERDCPWVEATCMHTALNGHLKYEQHQARQQRPQRQHGCTLSANVQQHHHQQ